MTMAVVAVYYHSDEREQVLTLAYLSETLLSSFGHNGSMARHASRPSAVHGLDKTVVFQNNNYTELQYNYAV